jgi:hypothetical protein
MPDSYLKSAFERVCKDAQKAEGWCVTLWRKSPYYGGPEEGGWWGQDLIVESYQRFSTYEAAKAACDAAEKLAEELSAEALRAFGDQCLREMDWCEKRGLDADYLPEPDGEESYCVTASLQIPENEYGPRRYE